MLQMNPPLVSFHDSLSSKLLYISSKLLLILIGSGLALSYSTYKTTIHNSNLPVIILSSSTLKQETLQIPSCIYHLLVGEHSVFFFFSVRVCVQRNVPCSSLKKVNDQLVAQM